MIFSDKQRHDRTGCSKITGNSCSCGMEKSRRGRGTQCGKLNASLSSTFCLAGPRKAPLCNVPVLRACAARLRGDCAVSTQGSAAQRGEAVWRHIIETDHNAAGGLQSPSLYGAVQCCTALSCSHLGSYGRDSSPSL